MSEVSKEVKKINPAHVAFVATTYYPGWHPNLRNRNIANTDQVRGDITLTSIRLLNRLGFPLVIGHQAGPNDLFKQAIQNLDNVYFSPRQGDDRHLAVLQAIQLAAGLSGVKVLILTQPEKLASLAYDCTDRLTQPILEDDVDLVAPKRNPALFESRFSSEMHQLEIDDNNYFKRLSGFDFDYFFGVTVFKNDPQVLKKLLTRYRLTRVVDDQSKVIWPGNLFPIFEALRLGLKIASVEIPFKYPKKQFENEVIDREKFLGKRFDQRHALLTELVYYLRTVAKLPDDLSSQTQFTFPHKNSQLVLDLIPY